MNQRTRATTPAAVGVDFGMSLAGLADPCVDDAPAEDCGVWRLFIDEHPELVYSDACYAGFDEFDDNERYFVDSDCDDDCFYDDIEPPAPPVTANTIRTFRSQLYRMERDLQQCQSPASIPELRLLMAEIETTKAHLDGVQVSAINAYARLTRAHNASKGYPTTEQGRGITHAVALATRTSPSRAARLVNTAEALTTLLPNTYVGLCTGRLNFERVQIIVAEANKLPADKRREYDQRLADNIATIEKLGVRTLRRTAQTLVDELHPDTAAQRFAAEAKESCNVSLEELGHGMSRLTATMPTPHAAYIYTVLEAATATPQSGPPSSENAPWSRFGDAATGETMISRGQAKTEHLYHLFLADQSRCTNTSISNSHTDTDAVADADVDRLTVTRRREWDNRNRLWNDPDHQPGSDGTHSDVLGIDGDVRGVIEVVSQPRSSAACPQLSTVPITIDLVISDQTLLGGGTEPATVLTGGGAKNCGTIPAAIARHLAANAIDAEAAWLRRLYVNDHGALIATSSKQRFFPDGLATMLRLRDQGICRTPWCDAPIRHSDHVLAWSKGGETTLDNGAGLCVRCNQNKDAPDCTATAETDPTTGIQQITYTEPTGQKTTNHPPPLPQPARLTVPSYSRFGRTA